MKPLFDDGIDLQSVRASGWIREQDDRHIVFESPFSDVLGPLSFVIVCLGFLVSFDIRYRPLMLAHPDQIPPSVAINVFLVFAAAFFGRFIERHRTTVDLETRIYKTVRTRYLIYTRMETGSLDELTIGLAHQNVQIVTLAYGFHRPANFFIYLIGRKLRLKIGAFNFPAFSFAQRMSEKLKISITDTAGRPLKLPPA